MSSTRDQREAEAERIVRRLIEEVFSEGRLEVADELIADDLIEHQNYGPDHAPGAEGVKAVSVSLRRAFPDFRLTIEDLVVSGDTVWTRNVGAGTNDGPYMGNPPTHRPMRVDVFDVLRVVDGKIIEHWGVPDRLAVLQQIGLLNTASSSAAA
jgi:predicted ester cyclase